MVRLLPCVGDILLVLSHISRFWLFATLWTVAHHTPLSVGFCRQEHWSGLLPCPPPGDVPSPGIEPMSLMSPALAGKFFTISASCFIDYDKAFDCADHNKLWKIFQEMGIPDHLTCLLRNLYAGQEATVRTEHGTTDWFQIGKGVHQGCVLSLWSFNLYAEYIT